MVQPTLDRLNRTWSYAEKISEKRQFIRRLKTLIFQLQVKKIRQKNKKHSIPGTANDIKQQKIELLGDARNSTAGFQENYS